MITPVSGISSIPTTLTNVSPTPGVDDVNSFNQLMSEQALKTTQRSVISQIGGILPQHNTEVSPTAQSTQTGPVAMDMLQAQYQLLNLSVSVDLEAKVAGQISQAINKLVSMQ